MNLAKNEFCHVAAEQLGHKVGQGYFTPMMSEVEAITKYQDRVTCDEILDHDWFY